MRNCRLAALLTVMGTAAALVWWLSRDGSAADLGLGATQEKAGSPGFLAGPHMAPRPVLDLPDPQGWIQPRGRVVVRTGWGAGLGELGRRAGQESSPEAPMSLSVDRAGNVSILDQVNRRVQRFDRNGRPRGSVMLPTDTAQDLVVQDDRVLVLDRLGDAPGVHMTDLDGNLIGKLEVVGGQVREGGGITGLFADGDGIYVESAHDDLVRVAGASGQPTALQQTIPGRPSRDGRFYLKAGIIDKAAGRVYVQAHDRQKQLAWETPLNLGRPLLQLLLLDTDTSGRVYLGAEVGQEDPVTHAMSGLGTLVVRLDSAGHLSAVLELPPTTSDPAETFRPLVVGDDGTLYHLVASASGVTVTAYRFGDG